MLDLVLCAVEGETETLHDPQPQELEMQELRENHI